MQLWWEIKNASKVVFYRRMKIWVCFLPPILCTACTVLDPPYDKRWIFLLFLDKQPNANIQNLSFILIVLGYISRFNHVLNIIYFFVNDVIEGHSFNIELPLTQFTYII